FSSRRRHTRFKCDWSSDVCTSDLLSVLSVIFQPGTDVFRARQLVAERLTAIVNGLPQGVRAPSMTPLVPAAGTVLVIGLTSEQRSLMDLRTIADWTVSRRSCADQDRKSTRLNSRHT